MGLAWYLLYKNKNKIRKKERKKEKVGVDIDSSWNQNQFFQFKYFKMAEKKQIMKNVTCINF